MSTPENAAMSFQSGACDRGGGGDGGGDELEGGGESGMWNLTARPKSAPGCDLGRGPTVRRGGRSGGWIGGSLDGWVGGVDGQGGLHTTTENPSGLARTWWGFPGIGAPWQSSISARDRNTVARFRHMRRLLSTPAPVPLCCTRPLVARCPDAAPRSHPRQMTTRGNALCQFRAP